MDNFDLIILKDLQFYQIPEHFVEVVSYKIIHYVNLPSIMGITVKWKQNFERV